MSYGVNSLGVSSFGAPEQSAVSSNVTINCTIADAVAVGLSATLSGVSAVTIVCTVGNASASGLSATISIQTYDFRIAVIGDSNASGRCVNNQPAPPSGATLYNNSGSFVTLADPWDGGTDTYSVLDDTGATGSFIPRLAQKFYDAGKTTLWIPANKGGTATASWGRSLSTSTCYGAMKSRIDAAGGVDKIIIVLGTNDAIDAVSQSTFVTRMNQLVADLLSDYPSADVYLPMFQTLGSYPSGSAVIRAGIREVWNGTSGVKPGPDFDGITSDVHYLSDSDAIAVADRTYTAITGSMIHGVVWSAIAQGLVSFITTAQYARPTSDVSTGTWTASSGSDLFAMLDETAASDADYIVTTGASTCEVALGTLSDPASSSGHVVRYRISADAGGITVRLRQGTTTIATWTHATAPTSLTTYAQTLTGGEADSITDYSTLRLQFEAT